MKVELTSKLFLEREETVQQTLMKLSRKSKDISLFNTMWFSIKIFELKISVSEANKYLILFTEISKIFVIHL